MYFSFTNLQFPTMGKYTANIYPWIYLTYLYIAGPIAPTSIIGSSKYGSKGLYTKDSFRQHNLPTRTRTFLARTANFSLAKSTWSTYQTTRNHLRKCQDQTRTSMRMPMDNTQVTVFLSWLLEVRRIKPSSAESYLAGLRQLHLVEGLEIPTIRSDIINVIIKGAKHESWLKEKLNPQSKRLPMNFVALKLLGSEINLTTMEKADKRLIWAVSLIAFYGSFRMGELLTENESQFDPAHNLLTEDVIIVEDNGQKTIQLKIKSPKESRTGKEIIVDLFENNTLCPVKALENWLKSAPPQEKGMPMFRQKNGAAFTKKKLNEILNKYLNKNVPPGQGFFSGHSYRSGVPSLLGSLGYTTEQIMCVGRWSSNSYECYIKTARTKRQRMAREVAALA